MTCDEAKDYLLKKLRAAGSSVPEYILPSSVCVELWDASGGWPGVLDRIALLAIAKAETLPVTISAVERPSLPQADWEQEEISALDNAVESLPQAPQLFVTRDGKTIKELSFEQPRLLVGRSEHNDIALPSRFVSRHHLLLVRHGNSDFPDGPQQQQRHLRQLQASIEQRAETRRHHFGRQPPHQVLRSECDQPREPRRLRIRRDRHHADARTTCETCSRMRTRQSCRPRQRICRPTATSAADQPKEMFFEVLTAHRDVAIVATDLDL